MPVWKLLSSVSQFQRCRVVDSHDKQVKVSLWIFSFRWTFWKASSALQLQDSFKSNKHTHGCTVVYPCYLGFCLLKMYPYKDITSILCTDVLYTVHNTSVCWYHYCSLAFTVESIKLIITEFVKSDKPKACSGFNVNAVETPESPQSVLSNKIYMYETY